MNFTKDGDKIMKMNIGLIMFLPILNFVILNVHDISWVVLLFPMEQKKHATMIQQNSYI